MTLTGLSGHSPARVGRTKGLSATKAKNCLRASIILLHEETGVMPRVLCCRTLTDRSVAKSSFFRYAVSCSATGAEHAVDRTHRQPDQTARFAYPSCRGPIRQHVPGGRPPRRLASRRIENDCRP